MAKTTKVGVSIGVTKNLGNYNSFKADAWKEIEVHDGDDEAEVYAKAWAEVEAQLESQLPD